MIDYEVAFSSERVYLAQTLHGVRPALHYILNILRNKLLNLSGEESYTG